MSERFIKYIMSEKAEWLLKKSSNAHALLTLIAIRARRFSGHPDGLGIGECFVGDHESCDLTRQEYRTALDFLILNKILIKVETCRTRQKSTTGSTTIGTKVRLLDTSVWDINCEEHSHRINHRPTTDQPPGNHEQEGIRMIDNDLIDSRVREEKKLLVFQSRGQKSVESILLSEVFDSLGKEGYSKAQIEEAIKKAQKSDPKINPGCILKYLKSIILNVKTTQKDKKPYVKSILQPRSEKYNGVPTSSFDPGYLAEKSS